MSSGDEVIWCFATQDICTDAPSIPADTLNMSTCGGGVITIDETLTMSSGTPAISTGNTHGLSVGPTVNASGKRHGIFVNRTSGVSHGPTQPSASGNSSSSTSYRSMFSKFFISSHTVLSAKNYLLCKYIVESWCPEQRRKLHSLWICFDLNLSEEQIILCLPTDGCMLVQASPWVHSISFVFVSATPNPSTPHSVLSLFTTGSCQMAYITPLNNALSIQENLSY